MQVPKKALETLVSSIREDLGEEFEKILIRPVSDGQVALQAFRVNDRDPEFAYCAVPEPDFKGRGVSGDA